MAPTAAGLEAHRTDPLKDRGAEDRGAEDSDGQRRGGRAGVLREQALVSAQRGGAEQEAAGAEQAHWCRLQRLR